MIFILARAIVRKYDQLSDAQGGTHLSSQGGANAPPWIFQGGANAPPWICQGGANAPPWIFQGGPMPLLGFFKGGGVNAPS